jgi:hypothetical protein
MSVTRQQLPMVLIHQAGVPTISYFTPSTLVNRLVRRTNVSMSPKTGNSIGGVDFADFQILLMEKGTKKPPLFLPSVRFLCDVCSLHLSSPFEFYLPRTKSKDVAFSAAGSFFLDTRKLASATTSNHVWNGRIRHSRMHWNSAFCARTFVW